MNSIIASLLTVAKKLNNYAIDATTPTVFWPDTTHYIAEVPAGKRWILIGGVIYRDNSSALDVYLRDASDKLIGHLASYSAATGHAAYPEAANIGNPWLIVLDEGEYVQGLLGTAQGTGAYGTCIVLEVSV